MIDETTRKVLCEILKKHSINIGNCKLKSGIKSHVYINCRPVLLDNIKLQYASNLIIDMYNSFNANLVACSGLGGLLLGTTMSALSDDRVIDIIYIRDTKKEYGIAKGYVETPYQQNGLKEVVIIDDVLTSGKTVKFCFDKIKEETDIVPVGAIVLVDREEGGKNYVEDQCKIPVHSVYTLNELL